jgi:TPR repeat protein
MKTNRIIITLMCLFIGLGIQAEDSKELKKLATAGVKAKKEKSGEKELKAVEKEFQNVIAKHPEEIGSAHLFLAEMYAYSLSAEIKDESKAYKLYRQAMTELPEGDKRLGYAYQNIGIYFQKGKEVTQNFDSAYVYFEKAQEIDKSFIGGYAQLIQTGLGTNQDPVYALTCYMEGISAGIDCYADATNLCYVFEQELNGTLDMEAKELYDMYFTKKLEGDNPAALKYLKEAVARNYLPALYDLGTTLCKGDMGEKNQVAGLDYLEQAADAGYLTAWHNYATLSYEYKNNDGKGHSIDEAMKFYRESMPYYEKAAKLGFARSQMALANMYFIGLGVDKDMDKAYIYAKAASDQGEKIDKDRWNMWGINPILIHASAKTIQEKVIGPNPDKTELRDRKLSAEKKQELDAEAAKMPTLNQYVTRLLNQYAASASISLGKKASTSAEKEQQMGKAMVGNAAANADFYQNNYNKFGRQVRKALNEEPVRRDYIASLQATMKRYVQEAANKGFTIERNEWETK